MRRTAALFALLVLGIPSSSFASSGVLVFASSGAGASATNEGGKPDRVYVKSKRDGSVSAVSGVVKRYELGKVTVAVASKENNYDALQIQSVEWGEAPPSFHDGHVYADRGAWADAAKSFRVAASDASARDVVKAAAKHHLAEALLMGGAEDPTRFTEAAQEAQEFLSAFATSLEVPQVRMLHARALWLAGKPAEAGAAYRALHAELKGDTPTEGYDKLLCLQAGIQAGRALLDAKDTLGAREVFTALEGQAGPLAAGAGADDPTKPLLQAIADEATLGSGYVDLAAGQSKQALTFFSARFNQLRPDTAASARFATLLGYGEALLAEGKAREAALQLAKVVGLDADRDRALRASVKMAEAYTKLPDADARAQACARIKDVLSGGGDSPASVRARQLAKELGC